MGVMGSIIRLATPACALIFTLPQIAFAVNSGPDFNNDSYADLAVGMPKDSVVPTAPQSGFIYVVYGSNTGISTAGVQIWHQDSSGIPESAQTNDHFGTAIAWGDFDGDGFDDLAVGAPGESVSGITGAGCVNVFYGSVSGLSATSAQLWQQDSTGIRDSAQTNDAFGSSLAADDFDNDGYDDLAIGVPNEKVDGMAYAGAVNVLYGSTTGLNKSGNQYWHLKSPGILGAPTVNGEFGAALETGDFNGDSFCDLAVSSPGTQTVNIIPGSASGLTDMNDQQFDLDTPNIPGVSSASNDWGAAMASGDFDSDGYADLAIGAPGYQLAQGAVTVLYGSAQGVTTTGARLIRQSTIALNEVSETADFFGWSLTAGDTNADGYDDLMIGVPVESVDTVLFAGCVHVVSGGAAGLGSSETIMLIQQSSDSGAGPEENDWFGTAISVGDFDGNGSTDLCIGAGYEDYDTIANTGELDIFYGTVMGLDVIPAQALWQDAASLGDELGADMNLGLTGMH